MLYPGEDTVKAQLQEEFKRAATDGHFGTEGWQARKDGSQFWANAITMALKDADGDLQGFARVVRDFSDRHERDEKLRLSRARVRPLPLQSTIRSGDLATCSMLSYAGLFVPFMRKYLLE